MVIMHHATRLMPKDYKNSSDPAFYSLSLSSDLTSAMKVFTNPCTLALGVLATIAAGARIMVINDDSWYTANIRYINSFYSQC